MKCSADFRDGVGVLRILSPYDDRDVSVEAKVE